MAGLAAVRLGWANVVVMIAGKEEYFPASPANNHIEMIEHIATEDAQVGCRWVSESSHIAADARRDAVRMEEF